MKRAYNSFTERTWEIKCGRHTRLSFMKKIKEINFQTTESRKYASQYFKVAECFTLRHIEVTL